MTIVDHFVFITFFIVSGKRRVNVSFFELRLSCLTVCKIFDLRVFLHTMSSLYFNFNFVKYFRCISVFRSLCARRMCLYSNVIILHLFHIFISSWNLRTTRCEYYHQLLIYFILLYYFLFIIIFFLSEPF